jgi:hypothetical protein
MVWLYRDFISTSNNNNIKNIITIIIIIIIISIKNNSMCNLYLFQMSFPIFINQTLRLNKLRF